ncbi:DUF4238 domain-containing protein [Microbacterium sp. NPDC079208]|uniref:DUF4238 domain-containing protein n=1 Tax=Microbacterium sp. NPDC079208 TaxID=3154652 RepID=UPI00344CFEA6
MLGISRTPCASGGRTVGIWRPRTRSATLDLMSHPDGDKHHFVPQSYLRRWAAAGEVRVVTIATGRRARGGVGVTAMKRGFYAVNSYAQDPSAVEKAFGSVEDPGKRVIDRIVNGKKGEAWPLSLDDRVALGAYIALQALRGPEQRRRMQSLQDDMVERETRLVEEYGAGKWFANHGMPLTDERARDAWDSEVGAGRSLVDIDALYHAQRIADGSDTAMNLFLSRYWRLVRFGTPSLITSDVPVSLNDAHDERGEWGFQNAPCISLPLSRTTALVLGAVYPSQSVGETEALLNGAFDSEVEGDDTWAKRLNARTIHNAEYELYFHPDDAALIPSELPTRNDS